MSLICAAFWHRPASVALAVRRTLFILLMEVSSPTSLPDLSRSVITSILGIVLQHENPGAVARMAAVCRSLHDAVCAAEGIWEELCIKMAWA